MSSNVHVLPVRSKPHLKPSPSDPLAALAALANRVAQIGLMPIDTKEDLQQAVLLFELFNLQAQQLIGRIGDDEGRARLLNHSKRIGDLVEIARRTASEI
jgi:hypothetical protein